VRFGGEYGNSRAARADGAGVWAWNRRIQQLARMECDLGARTTALGTADAAKWVIPAGVLFDATARDDQHEYVPAADRPRKQPSGAWGPTRIGDPKVRGVQASWLHTPWRKSIFDL
jgi:hypothetical protein